MSAYVSSGRRKNVMRFISRNCDITKILVGFPNCRIGPLVLVSLFQMK